jgi:hypothetical protein
MKSIPRPIRAFALFAIVLTATSIGASAAGNPNRQPSPTPPDIVVDVCIPSVGPVLAHITVNREYVKTFTEADGTVRYAINGANFGTFTRLSTGAVVSVNASGPVTITMHPDGTVTVVSGGLLVAINSTGIWQYAGKSVVDPATGIVLSHNGRVTDICQLLR